MVLGLLLAALGTGPAAAAPARRHPDPGKLSAKVRERATARRKAEMVDVLVRFRQAPGASERALTKRLGGQVRRHLRGSSRWVAMTLPAAAVAALAESREVEFVASDEPVRLTMDVARQAANAPSPSTPESLLKGAGVTIAILDSGVAPHPDLQTLVASVDFVGNPSPTPVFDLPEDPTAAESASADPNGHGTHVAGILAGSGSRSFESRLAGIAPAASLVSVRVLDAAGSGTTSDVLAGLQWVLDNKDALGIRVLNLSLGHPVYEPAAFDPLVQEVEALWNAGVVVVCSAGNSGRSGDGTITSPCNSREVVSVGASNAWGTPDPADDTLASYSSRGPTLVDLVAKPDLIAPGNRIVSTRAAGSTLDETSPDRRVAGDPSLPEVTDYFELSGTSMAAPMVAATAALMLEQDPSLNPGTIKARLMLSARKPAAGSPLAIGAGVLDITAALEETGEVADAPSPLVLPDAVAGELAFENTAMLWSAPSFSLRAIWSNAVLWSESTPGDDPVLRSYGVRLTDATASAYPALWAESTLWAEATLWAESTLWSEAVLWSEATAIVDSLSQSQSQLVDDPVTPIRPVNP
jgi:serine protease AprX